MLLFLYTRTCTFHLIARFYCYTRGKMRNKKSFHRFYVFYFLYCVQTIPITAPQFLFPLNLDAICGIDWINFASTARASTNNFRRKTMDSCIFLGSTIMGITFKMRFVVFVRVSFGTVDCDWDCLLLLVTNFYHRRLLTKWKWGRWCSSTPHTLLAKWLSQR